MKSDATDWTDPSASMHMQVTAARYDAEKLDELMGAMEEKQFAQLKREFDDCAVASENPQFAFSIECTNFIVSFERSLE